MHVSKQLSKQLSKSVSEPRRLTQPPLHALAVNLLPLVSLQNTRRALAAQPRSRTRNGHREMAVVKWQYRIMSTTAGANRLEPMIRLDSSHGPDDLLQASISLPWQRICRPLPTMV